MCLFGHESINALHANNLACVCHEPQQQPEVDCLFFHDKPRNKGSEKVAAAGNPAHKLANALEHQIIDLIEFSSSSMNAAGRVDYAHHTKQLRLPLLPRPQDESRLASMSFGQLG